MRKHILPYPQRSVSMIKLDRLRVVLSPILAYDPDAYKIDGLSVVYEFSVKKVAIQLYNHLLYTKEQDNHGQQSQHGHNAIADRANDLVRNGRADCQICRAH